VQWLPTAEFAYNNSVHASTGLTPFFANTGHNPALYPKTTTSSKEPVPEVTARVKHIHRIRGVLERQLARSAAYQAKYYDQRHQPMSFAVGQHVWLSSKNLRTTRPSRKLSPKYEGPFEVIEAIGTQAYRLRLPDAWNIHNVFHVSLLAAAASTKPAQESSTLARNEDTTDWEIQSILGHGTKRGQAYYRVRYANRSPAYDEWLPATALMDAKFLIAAYHAGLPRRD
jgi:hypothetical protein